MRFRAANICRVHCVPLSTHQRSIAIVSRSGWTFLSQFITPRTAFKELVTGSNRGTTHRAWIRTTGSSTSHIRPTVTVVLTKAPKIRSRFLKVGRNATHFRNRVSIESRFAFTTFLICTDSVSSTSETRRSRTNTSGPIIRNFKVIPARSMATNSTARRSTQAGSVPVSYIPKRHKPTDLDGFVMTVFKVVAVIGSTK